MKYAQVRKSMIALTIMLGMLTGAPAFAATINVGDHVLSPNMSGQAVQLFATGEQEVFGVNLMVQIGDGGPELGDLGLTPGTPGPRIIGADLITGTIFDVSGAEAVDLQMVPQVGEFQVDVPDAVVANGLIATLYFDTTGLGTGVWEFRVENVMPELDGGFSTSFAPDIFPTMFNGTLSVIPEPTTFGVVMLGGVAMMMRRRVRSVQPV